MLTPASLLLQSVAEPLYVTSLEELVWAGLLTASTMVLHGVGMVLTLRASSAVKQRFMRLHPFVVDLGSIIVASWMIMLVHIVEVLVWALFFLWKGDFPNWSNAYYFALMEYTTLGSSMKLPLRWRMLEGGIAVAGLLAFAWSTGVLLLLARDLQDGEMRKFEQRREKQRLRKASPRPGEPAHKA